MATEEKYGPNKQKWRDDFAAEYPDIDMSDEESYYGALNEANDKRKSDAETLERYEKEHQRMADAFNANPQNAEVFLELFKEGGDPIARLIENNAQAFADLVNDPDNDEYRKKLAEKIAEDVTAAKEREQLEAESQKNIDASLDAFDKVCDEMELGDEERASVFSEYLDFIKGAVVDKVDDKWWRIIIDGLRHDEDVDNARFEGEVAGRNKKIREKLDRERPSALNAGGSSGVTAAPADAELEAMGAPNMTRSVWDD